MARIKEIEERLKRWQTWYFTVAQAGMVKSPRLGVRVDGVPVAMVSDKYLARELYNNSDFSECHKSELS